MGAALSALGLGTAAYWNRHALFKFIMIAAVVMIICYGIIIWARIEEKFWPPVFMGGILTIGGYYMIETLLLPPPVKPKTMLEQAYDFIFGSSSGSSSGPSSYEYEAPEVAEPDRSSNPFYNQGDEGYGGKRRRPKRSK